MRGWFTLMETVKANGIDNPVLWLKQYSRVWAQHVIDETHTRLGDYLNVDRKQLQYDPNAVASFELKITIIRTMILILSDTPILKHSDSSFDADDWASVGVPRALLLLRFLPS